MVDRLPQDLYRRRVVEIRAFYWDGTGFGLELLTAWVTRMGGEWRVLDRRIEVATVDGWRDIPWDWWVIRYPDGTFSACPPDQFDQTYELAGNYPPPRLASKGLGEAGPGQRSGRSLLERVAQVYRDNLSGKPVPAVAGMLGLSQRTAARRIAEAREAGLLPATTRGKKKA